MASRGLLLLCISSRTNNKNMVFSLPYGSKMTDHCILLGLQKAKRRYCQNPVSIDGTLHSLGVSQFFTTLDLSSGYWQVELHLNDNDKPLSRLTTPRDHSIPLPGHLSKFM